MKIFNILSFNLIKINDFKNINNIKIKFFIKINLNIFIGIFFL